jgi:hypothetical protein
MKSPDGKGFVIRNEVLSAVDELIEYLNKAEPSANLKKFLKQRRLHMLQGMHTVTLKA